MIEAPEHRACRERTDEETFVLLSPDEQRAELDRRWDETGGYPPGTWRRMREQRRRTAGA